MSTVVSDEKATAKTAPKEYRQFIGGEWIGASKGATYADQARFTGQTMATIPAATREDAKRAVEAAARAFPAWWKTPPGAKQRLFLKAADILERRQMEVVGLLASETGCTFGFGMFQTIFTPNLLRQVAGLVYQPIGEILPADLPGAFYMGVRQPVGVVAGLAPWNAPLILSLRSIATPLAFGNTVVLKPAEGRPTPAASSTPRSSKRPASRQASSTSSPTPPARPSQSSTNSWRTQRCAASVSPARRKPAGSWRRRQRAPSSGWSSSSADRTR